MMRFPSFFVVSIIISTVALTACGSNNNYEIHDSITLKKFNSIYAGILDEVEALYELNDDEKLVKEIERLRANIPDDFGIITISQRDKGPGRMKYGSKYFYYKSEDYFQLTVKSNSHERRVPGMMKGYMETKEGIVTTVLQYRRKVISDNQKLDIIMLVDYEVLMSLMGNENV